MDPAPGYGSPYQLVPAGAQNVGSEGVRIAWDGMRYFYGTVLGQAWQDLQNVQGLGVEIV
jgi:hypothetical protein